MSKILSWAIGLTLGVAVGALLVSLFSPISGEEIIRRLRAGYNEALEEARLASHQRRMELEAELAVRQGTPRLPADTRTAVLPPGR